MGNEQFGARPCVRANNSQEAYHILAPHIMEYITVMADKSDGAVYISLLRSGKLYVAIQAGCDFSEFGKSNASVGELRQRSLGELR